MRCSYRDQISPWQAHSCHRIILLDIEKKKILVIILNSLDKNANDIIIRQVRLPCPFSL